MAAVGMAYSIDPRTCDSVRIYRAGRRQQRDSRPIRKNIVKIKHLCLCLAVSIASEGQSFTVW